jgi:hypothetical protein
MVLFLLYKKAIKQSPRRAMQLGAVGEATKLLKNRSGPVDKFLEIRIFLSSSENDRNLADDLLLFRQK